MGNATSIATKNGNERPVSNNETSTLVMDEFRMENTTSIATKDEKERPFSSNETSTLVMDEFREKVGFVKFVKSGVDDEHDEESTENRNVLQSGWPAVIFDSIKDFEHHKVNLKNKLSNKAAISEADTDILNYRKKLFQAGQRFSDVNRRPVAFLLDVDLLPKKRQRLIFDDETNVLNFATTVEAWYYLKDNYATSNIASAPFQVDARNSKKNQGTTVLRDVSNEMGIPTLTETKKRKGNSTYNLRSRHYNSKGSSKSAIDTSNEDAVKSPRKKVSLPTGNVQQNGGVGVASKEKHRNNKRKVINDLGEKYRSRLNEDETKAFRFFSDERCLDDHRKKFRKIQNSVDAGDAETLAKDFMATVFEKALCAKNISGVTQSDAKPTTVASSTTVAPSSSGGAKYPRLDDLINSKEQPSGSKSASSSKKKPLSVAGSQKQSMQSMTSKKRKQIWADRCTSQLDSDEKEAFGLFYDDAVLNVRRSKFQKVQGKIDKKDAVSMMKNYMVTVFGVEMCKDLSKELVTKAQSVKPEAVESNDTGRTDYLDGLVTSVIEDGSKSLYPINGLDTRSTLASSYMPVYLFGDVSSDKWDVDDVRYIRKHLAEMLLTKFKIGKPYYMLETMRHWLNHHESPFHPRLTHVPSFDNATVVPDATSTYIPEPPTTDGGKLPAAFDLTNRNSWGRAMKTGEKYFEFLKIFIANPRKHLTDPHSTPRDVFLILIAATVRVMTRRKQHHQGRAPASRGAAENHNKNMQKLFDHSILHGGVVEDDDSGVDDDANLKNDDSDVIVESDTIQFRKYYDIRLIATWLVWWKLYLEDKTYESLNLEEKSRYPPFVCEKGIKDTSRFVSELREQEALVKELVLANELNDTIDIAHSVMVPLDIEDWNENLITLLGYEQTEPLDIEATNNIIVDATGDNEKKVRATGREEEKEDESEPNWWEF